MGRRHWSAAAGVIAAAATLGLVAAGLPAAAVPPPTAGVQPRGLQEDATGPGLSRLVLSEEFVRRLDDRKVTVVPLGSAELRGERTLEIPVADTFSDGYLLDGGFRLESAEGRFSCPTLTVYPLGGLVFCLREDGGSWRLLALDGEPESTYADRYYSDVARSATPANAEIIDRVNAALGVDVLAEGTDVGTLETVRKRPPLKSSYDSRTNCEIDNYAGDNSINRGWALQALVNQIPQDVTVSQTAVQGTRAVVTTPQPAPINIGQRTPKMEGISVTDSKRIIRGSQYSTDHYWNGYSYSCATNAPFIVGPGQINDPKVKAWNYEGQIRTRSNTGGAEPQWWAQPRQTDYNGPTGFYTWTCRGTPNGRSGSSSDTYWGKVNQGTGFVGDGGDTALPNAGRAPACMNDVMQDLRFTTRYSISKRGGLEGRSDQSDYPRYCSVDGATPVGCWQEIYSGGWLRAWAFQYKIFATALKAEIRSDTRMQIPSGFESGGSPITAKPLSWRIVAAKINDGDGVWPSFTSDDASYDFAQGAFTKAYDRQDWQTPSPYTIPGSAGTFTIGGWGDTQGTQTMTFRLVGDTDGTWQWPVSTKTGQPLGRPELRVTLRFTLSNFDDKGSCVDKITGDNSNTATDRDNKSGRHCIEGIVPTLWPLPANTSDYWKRVHDTVDKDGKPIKPNVEATVTAVETPCWPITNFKFADESDYRGVPDVGADFTWKLYLSGAFNNYSGTGCQ